MCGIVGVLHLGSCSSPDPQVLEAMAAKLDHRGPDGHGAYVKAPIGLAMRRLSIIDLETVSVSFINQILPVRFACQATLNYLARIYT